MMNNSSIFKSDRKDETFRVYRGGRDSKKKKNINPLRPLRDNRSFRVQTLSNFNSLTRRPFLRKILLINPQNFLSPPLKVTNLQTSKKPGSSALCRYVNTSLAGRGNGECNAACRPPDRLRSLLLNVPARVLSRGTIVAASELYNGPPPLSSSIVRGQPPRPNLSVGHHRSCAAPRASFQRSRP